MKKLASISIIFFLIVSVNCALAAESNSSSTYKVLNQDKPSTANISQIEVLVHGINSEPVREATILLNRSREIPESQDIHLFSDSNGKSIAKVNPGTYDFYIEARNYQNESKTVTIFNGIPSTIEFTLIPETGYDIWIFFLPVYLGFLLYVCWLCGSSEKMKFVFILFLLSILIPFLFLMSDLSNTMFFYISLFFSIFTLLIFLLLYLHFCQKLALTQNWANCSKAISKTFGLIRTFLTILTILSWPLIAFYFACEGVETVVISDLNFLEFPSYIVIGVTIGVLSYLMLTIKNTFVQLLPDHERRRIIWECTRRIIIAPYIAIMGVYLIVDLTDGGLTALKYNIRPDTHFVFLFSIFAGMFTSTIEEWIYNKISDILSLGEEKPKENIICDIKKSDLFVKLKMNEDMIYRLYYEANIANMEDLANCDAKSVFEKLKARYSETEIQQYVKYAKSKLEDSQKTNVN